MSEQLAKVDDAWRSLDIKGLANAVAEKQQEQMAFYKANKDRFDDDRAVIFRSRNDQLKAMMAELTKRNEMESIYRETVENKKSLEEPAGGVPFGTTTSGVPSGREQSFKSLGEAFTESSAYKSVGNHETWKDRYTVTIPFENVPTLKATTFTEGTSYVPSNPRSGIVIPYAQRMPGIADLIPMDMTPNTVISYMEETTALAGTNAQVGTAENAVKFGNALAFTERTATVGLVATWLKVTNQVLDDVPGLQALINNRMTEFLRLKEEDMLMTGAGSAPEYIQGFLDAGWSSMLTQARGTDTNIDAIWKAIQYIRTTGFAEPDGIIMHPDNFTPIRIYKSTTGDYSFDVTQEGGVTRLFGKPLVLSTAITSGTALVGSFRTYSHISRRQGLSITVGLDGNDFTYNLKTILGEFRESLEIYRQTAFCTVTSLS